MLMLLPSDSKRRFKNMHNCVGLISNDNIVFPYKTDENFLKIICDKDYYPIGLIHKDFLLKINDYTLE